ncbi:MAG TPA: hypothetical protein VLB80_01500 [Candidatus Babeliales bacterium]|nr:hypothetical protein [Candidatus Babeliales bacterium]
MKKIFCVLASLIMISNWLSLSGMIAVVKKKPNLSRADLIRPTRYHHLPGQEPLIKMPRLSLQQEIEIKKEAGKKFRLWDRLPWANNYWAYQKWREELSIMQNKFGLLEQKYLTLKKKLANEFVKFMNTPGMDLENIFISGEPIQKILDEHRNPDDYIKYMLEKRKISTLDDFIEKWRLGSRKRKKEIENTRE